MRFPMLLAALVMLATPFASADTLYQAPPPPAAPGHPLRLGPDHRAAQIGDLVYVQFDFNDANTHVNNYQSSKQFSLTGSLTSGTTTNHTGALTGQSTAQTAQTANGQDSFVSTMMTTVIDVLPSGAFEISGDQGVTVNGRLQTLHITGFVRPQDINAADTVLASRVANVQATFKGDDQKNKGLLSRVLSWLF